LGKWLGDMVNVRKLSLLNIGILFFLLLSLFSCKSEEAVIPKGFEVIKSDGPYSFVLMDKKFLGDKIEQRRAGNIICTKNNAPKYCEVYFWMNRKDVQTSMPMTRTTANRGVYYIKDGKVKLTALK